MEMKALARQQIKASAEPHTGKQTGYSSNIYTNPMDTQNEENYHSEQNDLELALMANKCSPSVSAFRGQETMSSLGSNVSENINNSINADNEIIQTLGDGHTTTWQCAKPHPNNVLQNVSVDPLKKEEIPRNVELKQLTHRSSLKRHKSESTATEMHPYVSDTCERTYMSSDNIHGDGRSSPKSRSTKFRKAVTLATRLHPSPSTGRKLANYHLIAQPQSGTMLSI